MHAKFQMQRAVNSASLLILLLLILVNLFMQVNKIHLKWVKYFFVEKKTKIFRGLSDWHEVSRDHSPPHCSQVTQDGREGHWWVQCSFKAQLENFLSENWGNSCLTKCSSSKGSSVKPLHLLSGKHRNTCVFGKLKGEWQELPASVGVWEHS